MPHHKHRHRWSSCRTLTCAQHPGGSARSQAGGSWPVRRSGSLPWVSSCRTRPASGHEASEAPRCCKRAWQSCKGSQAVSRTVPGWARHSTARSCRKPSDHRRWLHPRRQQRIALATVTWQAICNPNPAVRPLMQQMLIQEAQSGTSLNMCSNHGNLRTE